MQTGSDDVLEYNTRLFAYLAAEGRRLGYGRDMDGGDEGGGDEGGPRRSSRLRKQRQ